VSSVRVLFGPGHEQVAVWNRGAHCGTLTVKLGEGDEIARRLITATLTELTEADSALGELRELVERIATHDVDRDAMIFIQGTCELLAKRLGWIK
jgi:hypothetical protein